MKVVAIKNFFGSGIEAKKGKTLDVSDKLGKAWVTAGIATALESVATSDIATKTPTEQKDQKSLSAPVAPKSTNHNVNKKGK